MLSFDPPALETSLRAALGKLAEVLDVLYGGEKVGPNFALDRFEDDVMTPESELVLAFPATESDYSTTIDGLIHLANEVTEAVGQRNFRTRTGYVFARLVRGTRFVGMIPATC